MNYVKRILTAFVYKVHLLMCFYFLLTHTNTQTRTDRYTDYYATYERNCPICNIFVLGIRIDLTSSPITPLILLHDYVILV